MEGNTLAETSKIFKVSIPTIRTWEKQYKKEGEFKKKPLNRSFKKLNPEQLLIYIEEHPDAYLKEIAEAFNCSGTAVQKAFKRLGITHKKRQSAIRSKTQRKSSYTVSVKNLYT